VRGVNNNTYNNNNNVASHLEPRNMFTSATKTFTAPSNRLLVVLFHSLTGSVSVSKIVLRLCKSSFSSNRVPPNCFNHVLCHTNTSLV
jgi:hypothetical protein